MGVNTALREHGHKKTVFFLSLHARVMTASNMGCIFVLVTQMLVQVSSKKMCL